MKQAASPIFHAPRTLTEDDLAKFEQDGLLTGFDLFGPEHAPQFSRALLKEAATVPATNESRRHNSGDLTEWDRYIDSRLTYELCTLPQILKPIRQILGPDLMIFRSQLFYKPPSGLEIPWHQESYFWQAPGDWVSLWLAIDEARMDNGALRVVLGSHRQTREHLPTPAGSNYWPSFKEIVQTRESDQILACPMAAGQFMLFGDLIHGSLPNTSSSARLSFTARYARPDFNSIQQQFYNEHRCVLVSGDLGNSQLKFSQPLSNGPGLDSPQFVPVEPSA